MVDVGVLSSAVGTLPCFETAHSGRTASRARACFEQYRGYPRLPGSTQSVQNSLRLTLQMAQEATFSIFNRIVRSAKVLPASLNHGPSFAFCCTPAGSAVEWNVLVSLSALHLCLGRL
jgi:hypothetical protein